MNSKRRLLLRSSVYAGFGVSTRLILPDTGPALLAEPLQKSYESPYRLKLRHKESELSEGFNRAPWSSPEFESDLPHREWYSAEVRRKFGPWGPVARQYPPCPEINRRSIEWLQDRVIHTASRWIGTPYQHHHIPDWNPPESWPWKKVAYGRNSKGIDCSNFSSFYYNYALGIKLDTGIHTQGERTTVRGPGGRGILSLQKIERQPYDQLVRTLQPADLLYIRNKGGKIAHVIMFLGVVGESPDGLPLVIDSTGGNHDDANGNKIPIGIHIRPFGPKSWYAQDFAHAHRIIHGISRVRQGEAPPPEEGGAEEVNSY